MFDDFIVEVIHQDYGYLTQILTFTIWQAVLSTTMSVFGGLILGRLIFSQQWLWAEKWLMLLVVIPTLSIAIGYMNFFIYLNNNLITGFTSIIICHCFFNLPLATLLIIKGYQQISPGLWQLTQLHRMNGLATFRNIEWPLLKNVIINTGCLIFAYCFSSFSIPLLMGGGPQANTITVALYYSLIVQGHTGQALGLLAIKLCISLVVLAMIKPHTDKIATHQYQHNIQLLTILKFHPITIGIIVILASFLLLPPLIGLSLNSFNGVFNSKSQAIYMTAIYNSLWLAILSSIITLSIGITILAFKSTWRRRLEQLSYIILMIPSFVISYVLIKLAISYQLSWLNAPICLIIMHCTISLPVVLKILSSAWNGIENQYKLLMLSLRLPLLIRIKMVALPLMLPALRLSLVLTISYCLSDVGGILLFDQQQLVTISSLIYDAGNHFDFQTSGLLSNVLIIITLIIFIIIHKKLPPNVTTH